MKLLALTFVRTGELIGAPWSEIDFQARRWEIPAERMKMRTPHIVPLSDQAIEVLQSLHSLTGAGRWLFPGDRDSEVTMSNKHDSAGARPDGIQGPDDRARLPRPSFDRPARARDTRTSTSNYSSHTRRAMRSVRLTIHALYLKPRAAMMQAWAKHLENEVRNANSDAILLVESRGFVVSWGNRDGLTGQDTETPVPRHGEQPNGGF